MENLAFNNFTVARLGNGIDSLRNLFIYDSYKKYWRIIEFIVTFTFRYITLINHVFISCNVLCTDNRYVYNYNYRRTWNYSNQYRIHNALISLKYLGNLYQRNKYFELVILTM